MANLKKKQPVLNQASAIEQVKDIGTGLVKSATGDLIAGTVSNALDNLFGPQHHDLQPDEEILFSEQKQAKTEIKTVKLETTLFSDSELTVAREIEGVRRELQRAISDLKELNSDILEIEKAIAFTPVRGGKYHLSFFARLKAIIKLFRQQVNESKLWLEASFARKKKKGYWSMFKKHGTSFSMSSERALASQAG